MIPNNQSKKKPKTITKRTKVLGRSRNRREKGKRKNPAKINRRKRGKASSWNRGEGEKGVSKTVKLTQRKIILSEKG